MKLALLLDYLLIIEMYQKDKLSANEISKIMNCSNTTIYNILNDFNIKRRTLSVAGYICNNKPEFIKKMKSKKGKNHHMFGKHQSEKTKEKIRKTKIGDKNPMFGKSGKLSPTYIHGKAYEPYTPEFVNSLKESIRKRDNRRCQLCNKKEFKLIRKLDIHHIDYNKENCKEDNLITLCLKCHIKTNFNRDYWFSYFRYIMENR